MPAPAPVVEMLWEQVSPADALQTRFGFAGPEAAGAWVAETMSGLWGIRARACERIVMSGPNALAWVETEAGRMLLKWSIAGERFPRLAAIAQLTAWLGARGVPVSAPVPARGGGLQLEHGGVSLGLQHVIDGELLDVADPRQLHTAGAALARLHAQLRDYPDAARIPGAETPAGSLAERVTGWLASAPDHVPSRARERLRELVDAADPGLTPTQLIHGDFRAANILVCSGEIVAVIDFEEVWRDRPIVELTRSAVLLGTLFHDWGPVSPEVRTRFRAGYESVRPLTQTEASWWDALVLWWSLLMIPAGDDPTGWGAAAARLV